MRCLRNTSSGRMRRRVSLGGDVIFSLDDDAFRPLTSRAFASRMVEVLSSLDI